MTPAWILGLGSAAVLASAVVALAVLVRRARRSRQRVAQQLIRSQQQVAELAAKVDHLAAELSTRRPDVVDPHEYVITTLAEAAQVTEAVVGPREPASRSARGSVADVLEEQAVTRLAAVDTGSRAGALLTGAGVKAVALSHGLRRALTQDNLDRAAVESHLARRRSRRSRRQELREARRLLRAVRAQREGRPLVDTGAARAGGSEDAA